MDAERWLPVVGWEGEYEVSDQGRVRSCSREVAFGQQRRTATARVLQPKPDHRGYLQAVLCRPGRQVQRKIHRLVLEAFVGPCPPGHECDHINAVVDDNRLANLRWLTRRENLMRSSGPAARAARATHCPKGHEYSGQNLYVDRAGSRHCRACAAAHQRRLRASRGAGTRPPTGGRQLGEENPAAKLTAAEVRGIRQLLADGEMSQAAIGARFGIAQTIVSRIKRGVAWRDVT